MSEELKIEKRGHAMWLTIDRPAQRNAMNGAVLQGIRAGLEQAHADPAVRAVVLTGAGDKAFCAGADLAKGSGSFQFDPSLPHSEFADLLRYAWTTTLPLVARVNGHCLAEHASFGLPEVKIGLFPAQVLAVLQHLCTPRHIAELCLTGEPIDARRAAEIGLINHVAPAGELDAKTDWLVQRLTGKSPTALRRGKAMMRAAFDMSFEQSISFLETQIMTLALTEDAKEGRASFVEKRAPNWTGR
jgi:methylglutaconyl-CoA hydratase